MSTIKPALYLMAAATLAFTQSAGAVGFADRSNAHTGKQLEETTDVSAALRGGTPDLSLRLSYENVNDSIPAVNPLFGADHARMLNLRTVLGYSTARFYGFYGRLEVESVTRIGSDDALNLDEDFSIPPGPVGSQLAEGHSIIADNPFIEINEAYLGWRAGPDSGCSICDGQTTVKLGRQTIIYDNHRWVGNIVWRQNQQSYDAGRIDNTSIPGLSLSYVYLRQVNRTFGRDSIFNKWEMDNSHLINASYKLPYSKLVGYGYLLNFDDNIRTPAGVIREGTGGPAGVAVPSYDSDTWGVRFVGKYPIFEAFSVLWELEFANQDPNNDANAAFSDNNYYNIEFGGAFKALGAKIIVKVGQETLEGNGVNALQTPLATFHGFNGWADKFVGAPGGTATPVGGLVDTSATVVIKGLGAHLIGPSKIVFQYHDYEADTTVAGLDEYGTEWGLLFAKPITKEWLALVKYANYQTDVAVSGPAAFSYDTQKFWLRLQYQFK